MFRAFLLSWNLSASTPSRTQALKEPQRCPRTPRAEVSAQGSGRRGSLHPSTARCLQQTRAATGVDVERGLAGTVLSLIIVGIVIVISVSEAWLPEAVTGV